MATFIYKARDQQGAVQSGALDASTEDEVIATLQRRGLLVTSIAQRDGVAARLKAGPTDRSRGSHRGVTVEDHVLLCQQLATLVEAGLPLLKTLEVVADQTQSRMLRQALQEVHADVTAGSTVKKALAKHPDIFSPLWLNLVETGEASGRLSQALQQLAEHFEMTKRIQEEAKTALTYPVLLMVAAVAVIALFVYWLIPRFSSVFATMDMELPLITRLVIGLSDAARRYVLLIIGGAAAALYALRAYLKTPLGRLTRDQLLLRLPVFKAFFMHLQLAEFSRGLRTLLGSGVPLLSSLEILERSATNRVYGMAIGAVREAVKEGKAMAEPMARTGLFPSLAVQMVQVGEEVGELGKMSGRIAAYYEARIETFIARMTRLFDPIAILVMGSVVLVIVLAIFMPIFQMAGGLKAK